MQALLERIEFWALLASIIAIGISFWAVNTSKRTAKIEILDSLQNLVIQKAKDCNSIYAQLTDAYLQRIIDGPETILVRSITEVIISVQLLDNALGNFRLISNRQFLLKQFWFQLDTLLRASIISDDFENVPSLTRIQVQQLRDNFKDIDPKE